MTGEIICGDCLDVMGEIPSDSVDLIVTDPPYKLSQTYSNIIDADNLSSVASILKSFPEMHRVLKPGRYLVCYYDNRLLPFLFEAVRNMPLIYTRSIYLYRKWGQAHRVSGWMRTTDPVAFFIKPGTQFTPNDTSHATHHDCYVKTRAEQINTHHPAQKPLGMVQDIIKWCSNPNELVLDPYSGSGTTCLAAKLLQRNYMGIDTSQEYCEMARCRLDGMQQTLEDLA